MTGRFGRPTLSTCEPVTVAFHLHFLGCCFHELAQSALEAHFGGRSTLRFQPLFEIPHANLVLDLRLPDSHRNGRLTAAYVTDPIVFTKHP